MITLIMRHSYNKLLSTLSAIENKIINCPPAFRSGLLGFSES